MEDDGIRPIDLPYRSEVDAIFKQIYREKRFNVMPTENPPHFDGRLMQCITGSRLSTLSQMA